MGLLSVCIGMALLGFLQIGILARIFGPQMAVIISTIGGVLALFSNLVKVARNPARPRSRRLAGRRRQRSVGSNA